jgi:hypothetical protein
MQIAQGAPGAMVPVALGPGRSPIVAGASGGNGTSMVMIFSSRPSVSKTWMRRLSRSAT